MRSVFVLALCLVQAWASPVKQPYQAVDVMKLPGVSMLNIALNNDIVDMAPGLARMPSDQTADLAGTLATFFSEMAFSCRFYGKDAIAESFETLVGTAPEIENLVVLNNLVDETWDFLIALRSEGLAVINLRSFVADTIEVMESTGLDLITNITKQVNDLKSSKQELIQLKVAFKMLVENTHYQFSLQVADVAEILRILSSHINNNTNDRDVVAIDMMTLFRAVRKQKHDLYSAVVNVEEEWARIEKGLTKLVGAAEIAPITENINKFAQLMRKEMIDLGGSLLNTVNAARDSYQAMLEVFPHARRIEE